MSLIDFGAGHRDLITVTKFNFYGNRIVTASSDHRMKVWDLKDEKWRLTDTWRAHDAEILDVRLLSTFINMVVFDPVWTDRFVLCDVLL